MDTDSRRDIQIMGIVNITDDSFYAGSRCLGKDGRPDMEAVSSKIRTLVEEGADIVDIGACSSRPGSIPIGEKEEWERLEPVLRMAKESFPSLKISIDTYQSAIVRKAFDTIGGFMVNDISAGEEDKEMLPTVGALGLEYVAMHKRGNSMTMDGLTGYGESDEPGLSDITCAVVRYFEEFAQKAEKFGIHEWVLDPGFGFAKTIDQNYQMLRELDAFKRFGRRILVGVSRKSMIYKLFGITPEESLPATQALHIRALDKGADILRVHDVAEAARTVEVWRRLAF